MWWGRGCSGLEREIGEEIQTAGEVETFGIRCHCDMDIKMFTLKRKVGTQRTSERKGERERGEGGRGGGGDS